MPPGYSGAKVARHLGMTSSVGDEIDFVKEARRGNIGLSPNQCVPLPIFTSILLDKSLSFLEDSSWR